MFALLGAAIAALLASAVLGDAAALTAHPRGAPPIPAALYELARVSAWASMALACLHGALGLQAIRRRRSAWPLAVAYACFAVVGALFDGWVSAAWLGHSVHFATLAVLRIAVAGCSVSWAVVVIVQLSRPRVRAGYRP